MTYTTSAPASASTSTSTSTISLSLSPPPKGPPKSHEDVDEKQSFPRPPAGWDSTSRYRRRSLAHIALLDTQASCSSSSAATSRSTPPTLALPPDTDTLPILSPTAQSHFEAYSPDKPYFPGQPKSLAGIALRAFCLGAALAVGVIGTGLVLAATSSPLWRLPFFLASLSAFHFLEFWTTAAYNTREADVSSFLLTANWPAYAIAHSAASLECLVTCVFFPARSWAPFGTGPLLMLLGISLVVVGQVVRSAAMAQAGPSFNHIVQQTQKREHVLITTGIYGTLRHPSYFGFFWWGLGTQLAMGNVLCFFAYAAVLWRFFSSRIRHEEVFLVRFFGDEYVDYKKKTGTKIPFVP